MGMLTQVHSAAFLSPILLLARLSGVPLSNSPFDLPLSPRCKEMQIHYFSRGRSIQLIYVRKFSWADLARLSQALTPVCPRTMAPTFSVIIHSTFARLAEYSYRSIQLTRFMYHGSQL